MSEGLNGLFLKYYYVGLDLDLGKKLIFLEE